MFKRAAGSFDRFEFDDERSLRAAMLLSDEQVAFITNERSVAHERQLELAVDPTNPIKFMQEQAGLMGQALAYSYLLECHETAKAWFRAEVERNARANPTTPPDLDQNDLGSLFGSIPAP